VCVCVCVCVECSSVFIYVHAVMCITTCTVYVYKLHKHWHIYRHANVFFTVMCSVLPQSMEDTHLLCFLNILCNLVILT